MPLRLSPYYHVWHSQLLSMPFLPGRLFNPYRHHQWRLLLLHRVSFWNPKILKRNQKHMMTHSHHLLIWALFPDAKFCNPQRLPFYCRRPLPSPPRVQPMLRKVRWKNILYHADVKWFNYLKTHKFIALFQLVSLNNIYIKNTNIFPHFFTFIHLWWKSNKNNDTIIC